MPDLKNIREYIRAMEHITGFLRQLIEEEKRTIPAPSSELERLSELTDLRMMSKSDIWPAAIDPTLISDESNQEDQINRADGILHDFMEVDLNGKRFLDYGCGDGYIALRAMEQNPALSVGYDLKTHDTWNKFEQKLGLIFTTDLKEKEFDIVLLNDVLDHTQSPIDLLKHIKSIKQETAPIYVRCHPWCSRHGTHLYRKLNKAYLHLAFSHTELISMGLKGDDVIPLLDPIKNYRQWFQESDLTIIKESTITQDVDAYFTTRPTLIRRIKNNWHESEDKELAAGTKYPHEMMQIQFADFVLV